MKGLRPFNLSCSHLPAWFKLSCSHFLACFKLSYLYYSPQQGEGIKGFLKGLRPFKLSCSHFSAWFKLSCSHFSAWFKLSCFLQLLADFGVFGCLLLWLLFRCFPCTCFCFLAFHFLDFLFRASTDYLYQSINGLLGNQ